MTNHDDPPETGIRAGRMQRGGRGPLDRVAGMLVAIAAALWVADAYFRPSLVLRLSASEIVFVEDLIIAICFLPFIARIRRELVDLPPRRWLALVVIALGAQAFATVLFTRSLSFAFPANAAPDLGVENEVYLLYLLQPVFGIALSWLVLRERRRAGFWPLAAIALAGVYLIVFAGDPLAPFSSIQRGKVLAGLLVLGAVILWASGTVFGRYALGDVSFVTTAAMRFWLALPALLALMVADRGTAALSTLSWAQIPSFAGIALIPGLLAMLVYYRGLAGTPASVATIAELAYPCALFLAFSLPPPVGLGAPLHGVEVVGAVLLVVAVTSLNMLKEREVYSAPPVKRDIHAAEVAG